MPKRSFTQYQRSMVSHKVFFLILFIIVLIALGVWLGMASKADPKAESPYAAVYLTTGDIYFGKFSRFPMPHITDAWHLDRGVDKNGTPQMGLSEVKNAFWAPSGDIYLNRNQIVFWTELRNDSQLIPVLSGKQQISVPPGISAPVNPPSGQTAPSPAPTGSQSTTTP